MPLTIQENSCLRTQVFCAPPKGRPRGLRLSCKSTHINNHGNFCSNTLPLRMLAKQAEVWRHSNGARYIALGFVLALVAVTAGTIEATSAKEI
jgi:hypothetical protein